MHRPVPRPQIGPGTLRIGTERPAVGAVLAREASNVGTGCRRTARHGGSPGGNNNGRNQQRRGGQEFPAGEPPTGKLIGVVHQRRPLWRTLAPPTRRYPCAATPPANGSHCKS